MPLAIFPMNTTVIHYLISPQQHRERFSESDHLLRNALRAMPRDMDIISIKSSIPTVMLHPVTKCYLYFFELVQYYFFDFSFSCHFLTTKPWSVLHTTGRLIFRKLIWFCFFPFENSSIIIFKNDQHGIYTGTFDLAINHLSIFTFDHPSYSL